MHSGSNRQWSERDMGMSVWDCLKTPIKDKIVFVGPFWWSYLVRLGEAPFWWPRSDGPVLVWSRCFVLVRVKPSRCSIPYEQHLDFASASLSRKENWKTEDQARWVPHLRERWYRFSARLQLWSRRDKFIRHYDKGWNQQQGNNDCWPRKNRELPFAILKPALPIYSQAPTFFDPKRRTTRREIERPATHNKPDHQIGLIKRIFKVKFFLGSLFLNQFSRPRKSERLLLVGSCILYNSLNQQSPGWLVSYLASMIATYQIYLIKLQSPAPQTAHFTLWATVHQERPSSPVFAIATTFFEPVLYRAVEHDLCLGLWDPSEGENLCWMMRARWNCGPHLVAEGENAWWFGAVKASRVYSTR